MHKILLSIVFIFMSFIGLAQKANVKGQVVTANGKAVADATVTIKKAKVIATTNENGVYRLSNIPFGNYEAVISADGFEDITITIDVTNRNTDAGSTSLTASTENTATTTPDNAATSTTEDAADQDNGSASTQNVGSLLGASRDPFNSAASFSWGSFFFRQRGYENNANQVYLNGIPMNELEDGNASFNIWGGLNDVFRSSTTTHGLMPSEMALGGLGNTQVLDASAGVQRKQTRITYSVTNRSYRHRFMITKSTGILKNGWAFSGSLSTRLAQNGPIPGTSYEAYSYFGAAEKKIKNHSIGLIAVGNYTNRGKGGPAMQEAQDLAGTNLYNPNWGYQAGKVRNSKVLTQLVPLFILTDDINLKNNSKLMVSASFQTGTIQTTVLDWYNSNNPNADFYKNLPSYTTEDQGIENGNKVRNAILEDKTKLQIQWDDMYQANRFNNFNIPGNAGNRSKYALGADVEKQTRFNLALNYQKVLNANTTFYAGANTQIQNLNNYRKMVDLLGGDYWVNVNSFAERAFNNVSNAGQNNINETSNIKKVGDMYGYHYKLNFNKSQAWAQGVFTYSKVDFFAAANFTNTSFYRTGLFKSGLYGDPSFGKSATQNYITYNFKGGATYKIDGRNYLYANAAIGTDAPLYDNVIISARTRNQISNFNKVEQMQSFEAGYMLRSPSFKARLTYFNTQVQNATDIKRYFDQLAFSLANVVVAGINKSYSGVEFGAEAKLSSSLSATVAASFVDAIYTNRPVLSTYIDNDTTGEVAQNYNTGDSLMYIKNLHLPNGPQQALSIGVVYRSPKFWMATITANYLAKNYMDFAPSRHTMYGIDLLKEIKGNDVYLNNITQKQLNTIFTMDASFSKSWRANKFVKSAPYRSLFFVNVGVSNFLNNKNIQLFGFEQLRVDNTRPSLFDAKYSYALGAQYFINFAYSF
jgi:Carboxypeptidase regulatory-like domain